LVDRRTGSLTLVSAEQRVSVAPGLIRDDGDGPRLIGAICAPCGRRCFPFADTCPWCGAEATHEVTLSPRGTLWAWTAVTAAPPGYAGSVPFGFGVVQLDDELRVVTRLTESDPARLAFGEPMTLVYDPVDQDEHGNDVVAWAFAPDAPR
jgi:uncharacterized OB-fold protein